MLLDEIQILRDAVMILSNAANNWCDYLDENDRRNEIEPIEEALNRVNQIIKNLGG